MLLSRNIAELEGSATLAVSALCKQLRAQGREVIDLSAGEPDFRTPTFAVQAGIAALEQGFTQYAPVAGVPALRAAIAARLSARAGRALDPAGVVVSVGAKQALFNACFALFGPGDEVLVPTPYWTSYPEMVKLARATPVFVPAADDAGFKVTTADLAAAATPRTRGLLLNSPGNPSGAVYTRAELQALLAWAAARDLVVISDEIYGRICFTAPHAPSVLDLDADLLRNIVLVDGVSKAFAMTGWRIGFSWCAPAIAARLSDLQSHITSGACTPAQYGALAAYQREPRVDEAVHAMVRLFRRRRDHAVARLRELLGPIAPAPPDGAFFLFLRVDSFYHDGMNDSTAFCQWLLEQQGVALVPGIAFGDDRCVRLSFAAPEAEILAAIDRLARAADALVGTA
ncbi:MAG TPA: pyridoxal phosphate-dependent aminotransferase [Longimicrobiales bacterium]|nr:pyridoxal phosphate-dependent aminotransferase [Longimicrobiales bacterium]